MESLNDMEEDKKVILRSFKRRLTTPETGYRDSLGRIINILSSSYSYINKDNVTSAEWKVYVASELSHASELLAKLARSTSDPRNENALVYNEALRIIKGTLNA